MHTETGYGFFIGGDPRRFTPDEESNTPEELENWRLACEAWDEGRESELLRSGCVFLPNGEIRNVSRLGLGIYTFDCDCDEEPDEQVET